MLALGERQASAQVIRSNVTAQSHFTGQQPRRGLKSVGGGGQEVALFRQMAANFRERKYGCKSNPSAVAVSRIRRIFYCRRKSAEK